MLNSFRNFTKSFWAKILLVIIIIPFVFWGMGGVFSGGSQNTLAKLIITTFPQKILWNILML